MMITPEAQQTLNKIVNGYTVKDKFYGTVAVDKAKLLFFGDDKLAANKWAKRWTLDEQNKAIYVTFLVKKIKHSYLYAKFIIGEGARLSVLGQRTIHKPKTVAKRGGRRNITRRNER